MAEITVVDRPADPDRAALRRLVDEAARHDDHPALSDTKFVALFGDAPFRGLGVVARQGDRAVGYAHAMPVSDAGGAWNVQTVVDPAERDTGLAGELTRAALDEAVERGANRLQWWAFRAGPDDDAFAAEVALAPWRNLLQMRRALPHPETPTFAPEVTLRSFVPGQDDDAWVAVNRRAFADHPEQGAVTAADLRSLMAEPWFDPADFLVAEDAGGSDDAGTLAGFCWTKTPDERHGEIYVIGVDPECRGLGLGRALVLAGLAQIASHGVPTATLYVDGDNAAAVALYEALGFTVDHVDRAYARDVSGR